jgi:hypothetical protein
MEDEVEAVFETDELDVRTDEELIEMGLEVIEFDIGKVVKLKIVTDDDEVVDCVMEFAVALAVGEVEFKNRLGMIFPARASNETERAKEQRARSSNGCVYIVKIFNYSQTWSVERKTVRLSRWKAAEVISYSAGQSLTVPPPEKIILESNRVSMIQVLL